MRLRKVLLVLAPAAAVLTTAATAANAPPASQFPWEQPGTAPAALAGQCTQPPAWVPAGCPTTVTVPGSSYVWAQPGTAALPTPDAQPPASVPIVAGS
jgi:hypothetical protein